MNTQRKIENIAAAQRTLAETRYYNSAAGGQVGIWHDKIDLACREGRMPVPIFPASSLETVICNISRWSGPATFVAAIAGLVYIL